jgi:hypothetical protein
MKLQLVLAAATMLAVPALMPASAQQSNVYVSGGYTRFEDVGAVQARVGVGLGDHFAIEGEGAVGVEEDNGTELNHELGVFAVAKLPINSSFEIFGRVGATQQNYDVPIIGEVEDEGLAYGAGGTFNLTSADGIRADWTRHDYNDADQWSLSYVRKF